MDEIKNDKIKKNNKLINLNFNNSFDSLNMK